MKSSVVVVNWNSGDRLAKCLQSLPADTPTVVVDNASTDGSVQQAQSAASHVTVVQNSSNLGFAAAINQGVALTSTESVLLLNPDVLAGEAPIQILKRVLEENPKAGAVGGNVNERYLPRPVATAWTIIRENFGMPVPGVDQPIVGQAAAAALLVRREAFLQVGGFDERFYPAWYEDVDFCRRLHAAGWTVHFARDAKFSHEGGYSAQTMGRARFVQAYYRNQLRYVEKHFGSGARLLVRASIAAGMMARLVVSPSSARASSKVIAGALWEW